MKPLVVVLSVFLISIFIIKAITQKYNFSLAARIGMCAMLFFTALGYFVFTKGMAMMIPPIVPFKTEVIYLTGLAEIVLGIGLLIPRLSNYSGWFLIFFFLFLLPANIYSAMKHIDYQKATFDGNGLRYLWFRVPLQIVFIIWTYLSAIKK